MKRLIISCKEATLLIIKKENSTPSVFSLLKLYIHLFICKWCRLFNKQNKAINASISVIASGERLSDTEKAEIEKKLPR